MAYVYSTTFTSANLVAGVLTVNHGLNQANDLFHSVTDNSNETVGVTLTYSGPDNITLDLSGYTVTGTWRVVVFLATAISVPSTGSVYTVDDLFVRARYILNDITETRFTDSILMRHVNDGMYYLSTQRSDMLIDTDGDVAAIPDYTQTTDTFNFDYKWVNWMVQWITANCFLEVAESKSARDRGVFHLSEVKDRIKIL